MPRIGCIADDFTGATDMASMLSAGGLRTELVLGVPARPLVSHADAVVVALKTRNVAAHSASQMSLAASEALSQAGCQQIYFKYCSTFDSTAAGNIGPVADALATRLNCDLTLICPALPANARTLYKGHLFVGDVPLDESAMRNHPLTPMRDSSLVRLMQAQTPRKVGLADLTVVRRGVASLRSALQKLSNEGCAYAVVDAVMDEDLDIIAAACASMPLVTGGSGLGAALARHGAREHPADASNTSPPFTAGGYRAVLAGSCSAMTLKQVAAAREIWPSFELNPERLLEADAGLEEAVSFALRALPAGPVLIYSSAAPTAVAETQKRLGTERASRLIESVLAQIAVRLVTHGVDQLIVAGGETSGAVVQALQVTELEIGPPIDPGVPWTRSLNSTRDAHPLYLALKSGNFGSEDFFLKAWDRL